MCETGPRLKAVSYLKEQIKLRFSSEKSESLEAELLCYLASEAPLPLTTVKQLAVCIRTFRNRSSAPMQQLDEDSD